MNKEVVEQTSEGLDRVLGQIANEYFDRLADSEQPSISEFVRRFPQYASELKRVLPALQQLTDSICPNVGSGGAVNTGPIRQLGEFRIVCEIGRGGMGIVYEAEQLSMGNRLVALKVLPFAAIVNEVQFQRFRNEVRAAASLNHPNIVPVYSIGEERGVHFYAMQLVHGQSLANLIDEMRNSRKQGESVATSISQIIRNFSQLTPSSLATDPTLDQPAHGLPANDALGDDTHAEKVGDIQAAMDTVESKNGHYAAEHHRVVANIGIQAGLALQHAHERGVVHRDVKPANLMMDGHAKLYLTDFGLAHMEENAGITMTGDLVGTLRYMSPEQALGNRVAIDHRTDIYSLGITLYECLISDYAFAERDRASLLKSIAYEELRPLRQVDRAIPHDLATIVHKCAAKTPADRYNSAQEVVNDLQAFLERRPILARPPMLMDRTLKWMTRNQQIVVAGGVATVLALIALSISLLFIWQAERDATREADISNAVLEFLNKDLLGSNNPNSEPNRDLTVREVLERASEGIDQRFKDQPLVAAAIHHSLGQSWQSLGDFDRAEEHFRAAVALGEKSEGGEKTRIKNALQLALLKNSRGDIQSSISMFRDLVQQSQRELAEDDDLTLDIRLKLGAALLSNDRPIGTISTDSNRAPDRMGLSSYFRSLYDDAVRLKGSHSVRTLEIMDYYSKALHIEEQFDLAETVAETLQQRAEEEFGLNSKEVCAALSTLGRMRCFSKEAQTRLQGLDDLRRACNIASQLGPAGNLRLVTRRSSLAASLQEHHGYLSSECEELYRKNMLDLRKAAGESHLQTLDEHLRFAGALRDSGRYREAVEIAENALETLRTNERGSHPLALMALEMCANSRTKLGEFEQSTNLYRELFRLSRETYGLETDATYISHWNLTNHLRLVGHFDEPLQLTEEVLNEAVSTLSHDSFFLKAYQLTRVGVLETATRNMLMEKELNREKTIAAEKLIAEIEKHRKIAAHSIRGLLHYRNHEYQKAVDLFAQVDLSKDAPLMFVATMANWQVGLQARSRELFVKGATRRATQSDPFETAPKFFMKLYLAQENKLCQEAQDLLEISDEERDRLVDAKLSANEPQTASGFRENAVWNYRRGNLTQALNFIRAAVQKNPKNQLHWDIWSQIALDYYATQNWVAAESETQLAVELAADRPALLGKIVPSLLLAEKSKEFHKLCEPLLEKCAFWYGPDLSAAIMMCALDPHWNQADPRLATMIQRAADLRVAHFQLAKAVVLFRRTKYAEALTELDSIPNASVAVQLLRDHVLGQQGLDEIARRNDAQSDVELNPKRSEDPLENVLIEVFRKRESSRGDSDLPQRVPVFLSK